MKSKFFCSIALFLSVIMNSNALDTEIVIDSSQSLGPVKKNIFGHNVASADPRGIFSDSFDNKTFDTQYIRNAEGFWNPIEQKPNPAVVKEAKTTGITMLRYPGGCYVANYDWRKAVGPLAERGDWRFGLDEFIILCRALGAEPLITCSDYVLPAEEMPQHLADMVEYLNAPATPEYPWAMKRKEWGHPEPYGVKWFELGNESGAGNYYCKPRRCFTPETYAEYVNKSAEAMRKIDPTIKLGVIGVFGKEAYKTADFIISHYYGPKIDGTNPERNYKSCMAHAEFFQQYLKEFHEKVKKESGRNIPIALTEYNIYYFSNKPTPLRYSVMAGLLCADRMRLLLQPECPVEVANYWQISNGYFGMFVVKDGEIIKRRATLAFYQLFGQHFGDELIKTEVIDSPCFEAPAAEKSPAAKGKELIKCKKIKGINIGTLNFSSPKKYNTTAAFPDSKTITMKFNGLNNIIFPLLSSFTNTAKGTDHFYRLSFESRFISDSSKALRARIGLGLGDSRGWAKTKSAMAIDGLELNSEWKTYKGDYQPKFDTPSIDMGFRVVNCAAPFYGTLEVRNLKVEEWTPEVRPAYQGLTAISSLSKDGKILHLIVFNKSFDQDITSKINLKGFSPKSAASWTVGAGQKLDSIEYKSPVNAKLSLPASGQKMKITFPAHSMTAIDFKL